MKKILFVFAAAALMFAGCTKELEQRVGELETTVEQIQSDLAALEKAVENKLVVNEMKQVTDGYELHFSDGTKVTIKNGAKGDKGATGQTGQTGATGAQGPKGDAFFESVELSEDGCYLVITLVADDNGEKKVYELPMGAFNVMFETSSFLTKPGEEVAVKYNVVGAADSDNVVVRVLSAANCTAVVDAETKTINVVFTSGSAYVDVYAINNATGEIKAKTLTFQEYSFSVDNTVFYASPAGGNVEVPVTTDVDYEYEISGSWLTYLETKAVRNETVVFTASEANTTDTDRTAKVTLKAGNKVLAEFDVVQKNYYPAWIADEENNPIKWAESFDLFKVDPNENPGASADVHKKGEFTFELSDDFSKGAYKINGMFNAQMYFDAQWNPSYDKGGVYYADVEGNTLTIHKDGSVMSYGFLADFDVLYDMESNTFSLSETLTPTVYGDGFQGRTGYVLNYTASVKDEDPAGGEETDSPLAGTWDQVVTGMSWPTPSATMTIAVSGNTVTITDFLAPGTVAVGTLNDNKITIPAGTAIGAGMTSAGSLDNDVVLTVADNTITASAQFSISGYIFVAAYSATKQADEPSTGGVDPSVLVGTWHESFEISGFGNYEDDLMTIELSDDPSKGQLKVRMFIDESYDEDLVCYANLSADGTTLTVLSKGAFIDSYEMNYFESNFDVTVSADYNTLTFEGPLVSYYQYHYQNFTATKN